MSAFLLSNKHIATLINSARPKFEADSFSYRYKEEVFYSNGDRGRLGQVLMEQNYRSINTRYNEKTAAPKFADDWNTSADPVVILKACDCYDYQSCETDDYEQTEAYVIVQAIRHRNISRLPGYDKAPWGIDG
jgi:hypothetical protein